MLIVQVTERANLSCLTAEAVESTALPLQGVDDVHGRYSLPASVLGVGDGITDDILQEDFEDPAGLLVDQAADALDTPSAGKATDSRLGDALDVVAEDLAVPLRSALAQALASLSSS